MSSSRKAYPFHSSEKNMQQYLKAGLVAVLAVIIAKRIPGVRDYL